MKHDAHGSSTVDPYLTPPVIASAEEVAYARELRRRLEQRYLNPANPLDEARTPWCVGAD